MVYTHIAAMFVYYYLHTWKSCLFICLTYPCSLSCLAQLWALYKSKTNKLQVLVVAVGGWTHFGGIHSPTLPIIHMLQLLFFILFHILSHILNSSSGNHYHLHHYKSSDQYWNSSPANEITG